MTLAMLHVDRARTRMPLACTFVSLAVLAAVVALWFISWLAETNSANPSSNGETSAHVAQPNPSSVDLPDAERPEPLEMQPSEVRGREF